MNRRCPRYRVELAAALRRRVVARSLVFFAIGTLVLTACGADGSSKASVRPFDEIRGSEMVFELDPSDLSRGIFHVTTTVPMICAIVWGVDDSFGRFNNSLSMNGTGIAEHDVSLPDVEPGVTYTYIVQGTTADGTLYRSERGTFRLDAAEAGPTATVSAPGRNIATKATVTRVSSEFSAAFAGAKAIDGDPSTEWATRGDGDNGSITLDLTTVTDITGAEFVTRSMADGSAITSTYTVSVDGGPALGPFAAGTLAAPRPAAFTARGRVVRFDIKTSSGGNVGAVEIRVFS
ncbi:MAG: discoidin domain-containing protein [Acidimicrobiales bacterium]